MIPVTMSKYRIAFLLATICTGLLLYIMAAIPSHKEQIFLDRGTISPGGETAVLFGFAIVIFFIIASIFWLSVRIRKYSENTKGDAAILAFGVLCLLLIAGEKMMVDEISHEYSLGWEAVGEWIVLYIILGLQLLYSLIILRKLFIMKKTHLLK